MPSPIKRTVTNAQVLDYLKRLEAREIHRISKGKIEDVLTEEEGDTELYLLAQLGATVRVHLQHFPIETKAEPVCTCPPHCDDAAAERCEVHGSGSR